MKAKPFSFVLAAFTLAGTMSLFADEPNTPQPMPPENESYSRVIERVAGMVNDPAAHFYSMKYDLRVLNVAWEDTGRFHGSAVGPNISDVTIQVQRPLSGKDEFELSCMPVVRFPNFEDETTDVPLEEFQLLVGNESGKPLNKISLREFLADPRRYLTKPDSWKSLEKSLLAPRDSHALVSAQACFLPIPKQGRVEFNPVIFNYQSYEKDPAVLAILATREGTSVTVIDNKRDAFKSGFSWGQRLFFNHRGERASLSGERKSDFEATKPPPVGEPKLAAAGQEGLNMVLLIQVPLKQKHPLAKPSGFGFGGLGGLGGGGLGGLPGPPAEKSDVEEAVIGHGKVEGPFTEIDGLEIRRDPKFPIRVTVQFYKATSNGLVSDEDLAGIATQINRVYHDRKYVGSLVVNGPTGRPTEHEGDKVQPPWWWESFWLRHEQNTGQTRQETAIRLHKMLGPQWYPESRRDLVEAVKKLKPSN